MGGNGIGEVRDDLRAKNCGANTARALLPVVFWNMNNMVPRKNRILFRESQSSLMEKSTLARASACKPSLISLNSSIVFSPSSPRVQARAFSASSLRSLVSSQRVDSGSVNVPMKRRPAATSCRPIGICHSFDVVILAWATA